MAVEEILSCQVHLAWSVQPSHPRGRQVLSEDPGHQGWSLDKLICGHFYFSSRLSVHLCSSVALCTLIWELTAQGLCLRSLGLSSQWFLAYRNLSLKILGGGGKQRMVTMYVSFLWPF